MEKEQIQQYILNTYTQADICSLFDLEILEWDFGYDQEEIDNYLSDYDFYMDHSCGEAENSLANELLLGAGLNDEDLIDNDLYTWYVEWLSGYSGINFNI